MSKRKTKSVHTNGVTPKQDLGTAGGYAELGLNGRAYFGPEASDFYAGPGGQSVSSKGPAGGGGGGGAGGAAEPEELEVGSEKRGVGLDFAMLDSTFLLSQVFPTLVMGMVVQLVQSVTAYIACSVVFGALAVCLASRVVVFEQKDLKD